MRLNTPVIVPKGHLAKLVIRFHYEILKRAGANIVVLIIRSDFWIIGCKRLANSVVRESSSCF